MHDKPSRRKKKFEHQRRTCWEHLEVNRSFYFIENNKTNIHSGVRVSHQCKSDFQRSRFFKVFHNKPPFNDRHEIDFSFRFSFDDGRRCWLSSILSSRWQFRLRLQYSTTSTSSIDVQPCSGLPANLLC